MCRSESWELAFPRIKRMENLILCLNCLGIVGHGNYASSSRLLPDILCIVVYSFFGCGFFVIYLDIDVYHIAKHCRSLVLIASDAELLSHPAGCHTR